MSERRDEVGADAAKARLTLPQVVAICIGVLSFFGYQYSQFDSVKDKISDTKTEITVLSTRMARVEEILTDRVTRTEFAQWAQLLQARNEKIPLVVPEVRR